jgi:hypothetical protein
LESGLYTIKYIYGPATVSEDNDSVIGSSIQGRVEAAVGIDRLTTIIMPMKGESTFSTRNHPVPIHLLKVIAMAENIRMQIR